MYNNVYNMNEGERDRLWIRDFRMKYATFLELVEVLRPYIQHQHTRYIEALPVTKAAAMVLYKLAKVVKGRILAVCNDQEEPALSYK